MPLRNYSLTHSQEYSHSGEAMAMVCGVEDCIDASGESSVSRTSTRSTVGGAAMENENGDGLTDESAIGDRDEVLMGAVIPHSLSLADDFSRARKDSNAKSRGELYEEIKGAEVLQDVWLDHPASAAGNKGEFKEVQHDNRENCRKFEGAAGRGFEEPDKGEEVLCRETYEWSSGRQRPTRATRRPTGFRDSEFETQFRPEERRKRCNRLGRGDQARGNVDKFCNFHRHRKKKEWYNRLGRGAQKKNARAKCSETEQQSASPSRCIVTTPKLSAHQDRPGRNPLVDEIN